MNVVFSNALKYRAAGLILGALLCGSGQAKAADGFSILGADIPLTIDNNWRYYGGADCPEGGYMGWIWEGVNSLEGSLDLKRTLPPGTYYVILQAIDYMGMGKIECSLGGTSGTTETFNRDWNKYWCTPVALQTTQPTTRLTVRLLKTNPVGDVQKYLLTGLYITTNANENVAYYGFNRILNYSYPTAMDTSPPVKGNLIQNSSFEVGMEGGWSFMAEGYERDFPQNSLWATNSACDGIASVRFPSKGVMSSRVFRLKPNKKHTLSMWVRSPTPSGVMLMLYGAGNLPPGFPEVTNITKNFTIGAVWKRIHLTAYLPAYPNSDYVAGVSGNPDLYVDAVQFEEGDLADYAPRASAEIGFVVHRPEGILFEDETANLDLVARNSLAVPFSGAAAYEVFDVFNRKIASGEVPLSLAASSRSVQPLTLPVRRGIFRVVGWVKNVEGSLMETVYAVVPRPAVQGLDDSSMMGVSPNLLPFQLAMHQRLGFKWARSMSPGAIFRWSKIEPVEGQITWHDDQVDCAEDYGMSIMGTIGSNNYWPAWADNNGLPNLDKWESFVERLVTHYKGRVHCWEIWNEPVYNFTPQFYAELLKRAAAAIKRADPNAKIVGMGGVYSKDWILQVMGLLGDNWRQHLDYISTHFYPPSADPYNGEIEDRPAGFKKDVIDRFGVEVWNTETGVWDEGFYKTAQSNVGATGDAMWPHLDSERYVKGSHFAPELLLVNFFHCTGNGLTKYFYYDSRIYVEPGYGKAHPTMLEYDDTIRSKGIAYAIAGYFVDRSRGLGNISPSTNAYAYLFDRGGRPTVAMWSKDKMNHSVRLGVSGWKAFDMMGNELSVSSDTFPVGRAPVYVQSDSMSVDAMRSAFQGATLSSRADALAPSLSIDEFPTGPIPAGGVTLRWVALDETWIPSAGKPSAVLYSYQLEGRDADWSAWTAATQKFYPDLAPGTYKFQVRARDASGNISPVESRTIAIKALAGTRPPPVSNVRIVNVH